MGSLAGKLRSTPFIARVAPFIVFAGLTALQGQFGAESRYWIYVAKTLAGVWLLWAVWPVVPEMRWKASWEALLVGVVIFFVWVGLDPYYPKWISGDSSWNPPRDFGEGAALAWFFIIARIVGSTLVVPPLEEMFYRSFVYRYLVKADFTEVSLKLFHPMAFFVTSAVFAIVHREWLAGFICGMAYQWLVIRKGHLGEAMTAHAVTNLLLGSYVAYKGAWQFW